MKIMKRASIALTAALLTVGSLGVSAASASPTTPSASSVSVTQAFGNTVTPQSIGGISGSGSARIGEFVYFNTRYWCNFWRAGDAERGFTVSACEEVAETGQWRYHFGPRP